MNAEVRPLAVITGASSGIGLELARVCADDGFDLVIAADRDLEEVIDELEDRGAEVTAVEADLSTSDGIDQVLLAVGLRPVDALLANAGHGLGKGFLDQDFSELRHLIDTNITRTLELIHRIGQSMRRRGAGRILITGSIAGFMPGTFHAAYNASKAFIDSFSWALRNELKDTGVTVTCLMPGPTETEFFERADLLDTKLGTEKKADPAKVAQMGFKAMMDGDGDVVAGFKDKVPSAVPSVTPSGVLAEQHRKKADPGSARE
jgi:short-subunit dehydrogenase